MANIRPGGGGGGTTSGAVAQLLPVTPFAKTISTIDPRLAPGAGAYSANHAKGVRVIVPTAGTLKAFSILVGTASGNCEGFILDCTATTRNVLWSSGTKVVTGTNAWQTLADPNLVVTAGQHLDFCLTVDNATATVGRTPTVPACGFLPAGFPAQAPLGGANDLVWDAAQTIPIGGTLLESGMGTTSVMPLITCYIA